MLGLKINHISKSKGVTSKIARRWFISVISWSDVCFYTCRRSVFYISCLTSKAIWIWRQHGLTTTISFIWWEFLNLKKQASYWNSHYSLIWEPETTLIRNVHLTSISHAIGFKLYNQPDGIKWQGVRQAWPIRAIPTMNWNTKTEINSVISLCINIWKHKWKVR